MSDETASPTQQDLDDMSLEQIEALMDQEAPAAEAEPSEPEPTPPESSPEEAPVEEPQETVDPDESEAATPEAPPAEEPEPVTVEQLREEFDFRIKEQELRNQKAEAERMRFEMLAGRHAGELGHLKQVIQNLQQPAAQPAPQQFDDYADHASPPPAPVPGVLDQRVDRMEAAEKVREVEAEYASFIKDHPEAVPLMAQMAPSIQQGMEPYAEIAPTLQAPALRKLVRSVFDATLADVQLAEQALQRKAALEKKAVQVQQKRIQKREATSSGTGPPPAAPQLKTIEEMTWEEADAELTRLENRRRRRFA